MSGSDPAVLVVGEALVDVVERAADVGHAREEHVGGSPTNVAMGLARLGHPTRLAACVGDDDRGRRVAEHLTSHGVELTDGSVRAGATSTAHAVIGEDGAASYAFDLTWEPALAGLSGTTVGHVHTGSLATVLPPGADDVVALVEGLRSRASVSYDPNVRPAVVDPAATLPGVERMVGLSDVVKASDEDAELLYPGDDLDDVVARWLGAGPGLVVVTQGAKGVTWACASGARGTAPTQAREVADTVGAGDSFMAGLLSALVDAGLLGGPDARERLRSADAEVLGRCVERGLATSAVTVGRVGAYAPTRADLP